MPPYMYARTAYIYTSHTCAHAAGFWNKFGPSIRLPMPAGLRIAIYVS